MTRPPRGAPWPSAATRLVVLLGWPARHSLSPQMHNAAFAEHDLDLVYLAAPTPPESLAGVVAALGNMGAVGANVTVPHKQRVLELCDHLTDEARLVGAVNTLAWTADGLVGDNTDATGLQGALHADIGLGGGERYVVLGTGGAARAAVTAVGRLAGQLTVVGRRGKAAEELAALGERAGATEVAALAIDHGALAASVADARVVVNATPLGMAGERLPDPFHSLDAGQVAYDLVYDPARTPFLTSAHERGVAAHNGLGMLVGQAAQSYRIWTGREAPFAVISAVATAALAERVRHG